MQMFEICWRTILSLNFSSRVHQVQWILANLTNYISRANENLNNAISAELNLFYVIKLIASMSSGLMVACEPLNF